MRELHWVDDTGESEFSSRRASYVRPRFSPDGRRLAVEIEGSDGANVWIHDIERDTATRLTADGQSGFPVWSADGHANRIAVRGSAPVALEWTPPKLMRAVLDRRRNNPSLWADELDVREWSLDPAPAAT